ncbi:tRNA 2-thiouridine(34) synthase MnmA [[Mycoplasma] mobile]|uniref:tRNA-specific 2-thiouridylase MnmA n=1 Tax=Mycoplasma mobile (strain ATCC 43663 / 163K / NCTC 11711) TaxID=267748 RepID=MNMA_MYCM1|nr:tRNA 2-thiouridine(34) synthase MnmA [[Mycoplasma] mobile]Q6KHK4.1 RecName: Full=tRNA-specific 2-thiouridylase MnmA [Mycoplasma mobile 163K]AAT27926.1 tRNA-methyltransferase (5-methylaminomethyl-2-thiouridylate) [Mycoplasma mobile 163K]
MSKIVVALSGGVDSSVTAFILKYQQNHEVIAVFMRNWDSFANNDILGNEDINQDICPQEKDWEDAKKIASQLNIPIYRVDFVKEYYDEVFTYLIEEYRQGRTPNPDIFCNKYIKFGKFIEYVEKNFNPDFIATGHYAKVENSLLYRAKDRNKDQSYFLSQLSSDQLKKIIFPLKDLTKDVIRKIAAENNLVTAQKKDSTGICFIGERNFDKFLQNYIPNMPGNIVDIETNEVVGQHVGVMYYTLGQRKINLSGMKYPYYVAGHDLKNKILYVASIHSKNYLKSDKLEAIEFNLINKNFNKKNLTAKFRYRQEDIKIEILNIDKNKIEISYPDEFEAVTPGQHVVIYDGESCVGGGIINKTYYKGNLNQFH